MQRLSGSRVAVVSDVDTGRPVCVATEPPSCQTQLSPGWQDDVNIGRDDDLQWQQCCSQPDDIKGDAVEPGSFCKA